MMYLSALFTAVLSAFIPHAVALNALPNTPCTGLIGCGGGSENVILNNIPQAATLMITIASGCGVVFIAWAGFQMVLALGNESKIGEQKNAILYVMGGLLIAILSQTAVQLVGTDPSIGAISSSNLPIGIMSAAVEIILTVFNGVFAIAIIVGGIRMVYAQGKSDEFNNGRKIIVWSIIGAVITNLSNALVQALASWFSV